jgi:hypothetical protein
MSNDLSLYYSVRDNMQSADLVFWKGAGPLEEVIEDKSGGLSHVALIVRMDEYKSMTDRVWVMGSLLSGFELRLLSEELANYDGEVFWAKLRLGYDRDKPVTWALQHDAVPYDKWGLVKQLWERTLVNDKIFFCSGGVYLSYRAGDIVPEQEFSPWPSECARWNCLIQPFTRIL